jgi:acetyl esterase/lipase
MTARDWAAVVQPQYSVDANITYQVAGGLPSKLDVYVPRGRPKPHPTVIYIHGGGWVKGSKEQYTMELLPFLQRGMAAVNVAYRLAGSASAPAAVADCRCALRWVGDHAEQYGLDLSRVVVAGHSAGGHLSLMTGMLDPAAGLDNECPGKLPIPRVAAIVDFYGVTDVADLLKEPNRRPFAVQWIGTTSRPEELAKRLSPLTYVRKGLPPVFAVHGDADETVPYDHSVRLTRALTKVGVPNQLFTVKGGGHGGFEPKDWIEAQRAIDAFLKKNGVLLEQSFTDLK